MEHENTGLVTKQADEVIFYDHNKSLRFADLIPRIAAVQNYLLDKDIKTCVIYNERVDMFFGANSGLLSHRCGYCFTG
jgi:hypothetical protein